MKKNYNIPDEFYHDAEYIKNLKPSCHPAGDKIFITEPTLLTEDLGKRAFDFSKHWLTWSIWLQLIRRDFILSNNLRFVGMILDDKLFTICEICSAKRYLVVPNVIYMHRSHSNSLLKQVLLKQDNNEIKNFIHCRLTMLKEGILYFDNFLSKSEVFSKRLDLKYILFDFFFAETIRFIDEIYMKVPAPALDEILRKEFSDGDNTALTAFIFNAMNIYRLQLMQAQQRITALENELRRTK